MKQFEELFEASKQYLIVYGGRLVLAIITLVIGFWIISRFTKALRKILKNRNVDETLQPFFVGLLGYTLKILLVISVMAMIGIQMTSFIAVMGAAGLAVGMALSGTLQNFAGGVILLLLKPFKKGDYIEAQGHAGSVEEVQIFNTILKTPDNRIIYLPNGALASSSMINYSKESTRRVDFSFGIGYGDDIDKAKNIIKEVIESNGKVLTDPAPLIVVGSLGDSSVNITTRVWVNSKDYWEVYFYMNENVKKQFDSLGITIPFPQRDVHIYNEK